MRGSFTLAARGYMSLEEVRRQRRTALVVKVIVKRTLIPSFK